MHSFNTLIDKVSKLNLSYFVADGFLSFLVFIVHNKGIARKMHNLLDKRTMFYL